MTRRWRTGLAMAIGGALVVIPAWSASAGTAGAHASITTIASTVPPNGDVNPYGVAVVPTTTGSLVGGDILVSNFNAASNLQGTGTTIVQISPAGHASLFARIRPGSLVGPCPGGVGLTTALGVLHGGWVIVGSLPTSDGTSATARAGCLIVLSSSGTVAETISGGLINGPWDMTTVDRANGAVLFVTNVLNGTVAGGGAVVNRGTVVRVTLDTTTQVPSVTSEVVVGSGFGQRTDPAALVVGPTGVGLGSDGTLFVADSVDNRISAIPNALTRTASDGTGADVTANGLLNDPLGLVVAPNGDILTTNGGNGKLVDTTPAGTQVRAIFLDKSGTPPGAGALFGLANAPGGGEYFVDDATNTLDLLH